MTTGRINQGSLPNFIRVTFHIFLRRTCHHQTRRLDKSPPLSLLHWLKTTFLSIVSRLHKCVFAPFICQCNTSEDDPFKHLGHQLSSYFLLYMQCTGSLMHFQSADLESCRARITSRYGDHRVKHVSGCAPGIPKTKVCRFTTSTSDHIRRDLPQKRATKLRQRLVVSNSSKRWVDSEYSGLSSRCSVSTSTYIYV